jgi:hypothetical protein
MVVLEGEGVVSDERGNLVTLTHIERLLECLSYRGSSLIRNTLP